VPCCGTRFLFFGSKPRSKANASNGTSARAPFCFPRFGTRSLTIIQNTPTSYQLIEETENQAHGVVGSSTVVVLVPDIHSTHQFYHWYTELDVRKKVEWDERFRCHAEVLKQNVTLCDRLLQKADETQAFFVDLRVSYRHDMIRAAQPI